HEDVEAPEVVDRLTLYPLRAREVGDVLAVRDRFAARGFDLLDDLLRRRVVVPFAGERRAEVVDDDLRAGFRECECVSAADPAPRAGDDRDLAGQVRHGETLTPDPQPGCSATWLQTLASSQPGFSLVAVVPTTAAWL